MSELPVYLRTNGDNGWATPRPFVAAVLATLGLPPPTLDVAATARTRVCQAYLGPDHLDPDRRDALTASAALWASPGPRWLQPPYGRTCRSCADGVWKPEAAAKKLGVASCAALRHLSSDISDWMKLGAARSCSGSPVVALVAARVDTDWWQEYVSGVASRVLFVHGRMKFLVPETMQPAEHPAGFPSAVIEYRPGYWRTGYGTIETSGQALDADQVPALIRGRSTCTR